MTTTPADVWVNGYTTGSGVQVAGHWRRRSPSTGLPGQDATTTGPTFAAAAAGAPTALGPGAPVDPVAAAEQRYRTAAVAAGLSALRHRRDRDVGDHQAALRERAAARAELAAAHPAPPDTHDEAPADRPAGQDPRRCPDCGQFRDRDHQCPTPAGLPAGNYARMTSEDRVKAMTADLEDSVKAIVESGQLHRWLDAMASNGLNRWSANNRLLAAVQMVQRGESLEGLHLMGFRQWEKYDRKVSKGAKAVWILAPVTRKIVDEDDTGHRVEHHRVVGFKGVAVFNVSDTHGRPLPEAPARPAHGQATPGTLDGLRDRVGQAGYTYQETEIPGCDPVAGSGRLGYTDPADKHIVVDARLSDAQKASVIAHELGHVHCGHVDNLDEYRRHRGRMETEAEMTAYLVNRSRGMTRHQVDSFSPGYIAGWAGGDPTVIHAALEKATTAFNKIMDGPWPAPKGA